MWDKITCLEIMIMETNKKNTWRKTHQRETTKSFEIFILLTRAYFYLKIVLPSVTYGLCLSWGFCKKTGLKELEKNHVLAAKSIWLVSLINNSKHSFGNSHLDARANWFSLKIIVWNSVEQCGGTVEQCGTMWWNIGTVWNIVEQYCGTVRWNSVEQ